MTETEARDIVLARIKLLRIDGSADTERERLVFETGTGLEIWAPLNMRFVATQCINLVCSDGKWLKFLAEWEQGVEPSRQGVATWDQRNPR
jgi:hypothetical protein